VSSRLSVEKQVPPLRYASVGMTPDGAGRYGSAEVTPHAHEEVSGPANALAWLSVERIFPRELKASP
jgi:hypothetical protein